MTELLNGVTEWRFVVVFCVFAKKKRCKTHGFAPRDDYEKFILL